MKTEKIIEQTYTLKALWTSAIKANGSVAIWRFPRKEQVHFLADLSDTLTKGRIDLQNKKPRFVVSPFMNPEGNETLFLKSDILAACVNGEWRI